MTLRSLSIEIVGAGSDGPGRMSRALVSALRAANLAVPEPGKRGATGAGADVVILAVPDAAIADAAAAIAPGRIVAHLSGATSLAPLLPHECFSLHPLMTVTGLETAQGAGNPFAGVSAAISASSERALGIASEFALVLGMVPFHLREEDRTAYHAAASIASNYLVTLEWVAEELARSAGVGREAFLPLITASLKNWAEHGATQALTGPIARGDTDTVAGQRAAVEERVPQHLALFDALAAATQRLADSRGDADARDDDDAHGDTDSA